MIDEKRGSRLFGGGTLLLASTMFLAPAYAQNADSDEDTVEEITVTGSRIRRDEFSSPSPIQVLDVDSGRQLGISSISEMLQRATVANGQQIDQSLNTNAGNSNATEAPATGGVGSSNIDLRSLGPERTLVMVNGRRLGSVGVRGAPAQPDINMIPFSMVERVEVLTEGVSAVYGADAVAGVVNVIMREDFEGFEVSATTEIPKDDGGGIGKLSLITGAQSDRASIIFGAEVATRDRVKVGDRDFSQCYREIEQTETGDILSTCYQTFFDNVILAPGLVDGVTGVASPESWFFYTPGQTNIGRPGYSDWNALPDPQAMNPVNGNTGTFRNFGYFDFYNDQDERRAADLVGELERFSLVTQGKVNLDWWSNEEFFFEAYYLNNQTFSHASTEQIFPDILGSIPQEDANGNIIVDGTGAPILVPNPLNPLGVDALPILTLESLPQTRDVERQQARIVAGLRGDFGDSSWSYEGYYSYDRGTGFQAQPILFENNLILATQTIRLNAAGDVICGVPNPTAGYGGFDTPNACVPFDVFGVNSNGATWDGGVTGEGVMTDAELAYLIGNRTNRTVVEQSMVSGFATGDLFEIADRMVAGAVGAEFRTDKIHSQNDITGTAGFNAAENPLQEGQTIGERDVAEAFAEINVPLLDNLNFDAAIRFTDESNFGQETTWRARFAYVPTDYLTLSASAGTSFRAPNLREQFLADQGGGIGGGSDPCLNVLIQGIDPDSAEGMLLIDRCIESGVVFTDEDGNGNPDTTVLGTQGVTTIPISTGGKASLQAETSDSYTATIQFTQPWTDRFDLDVALSYWSIDIENTVEEPDAGFIINQCFTNDQLPGFATNPFCDLLSRPNTGNAAGNIINFVDVSFINIGRDTAKGIDLNTRLLFTLDSLNTDVSWATATTNQLERKIQPFGPETLFDNVGTIGTPEFKFTSTLSLIRGDFEVLMQNRFIGKGQQLNSDPYVVNSRTIYAASLAGIASRDVDSVDSTWYTDLSATYLQDTWSVTLGINNLFEEDPPLINVGEGPNRNNAVSSTGYDFFGRTIFASASFSF